MRKPYSIKLTEMAHGNRPFAELVRERRERGMSWRQIAADLGNGLTHVLVWRHGADAARELEETTV